MRPVEAAEGEVGWGEMYMGWEGGGAELAHGI